MLLNSYEYWIKAFNNKLTQEKNLLIEKIFDLRVIAIVRSILQDNGSLIKSSVDVINIYNNNIKYQNSDVKDFNIQEIISKHNIKTLLEYSINSTSVQNKIDEINKQLDNMSQTAYHHLLSFFPNIK